MQKSLENEMFKVRILRQKLLDEPVGNCLHGLHSRRLENVLLAHHLNADMAVVSVLYRIISSKNAFVGKKTPKTSSSFFSSSQGEI